MNSSKTNSCCTQGSNRPTSVIQTKSKHCMFPKEGKEKNVQFYRCTFK
uniref:Uncharacterized protein n=1 Tax=Arundo donax TaxID=35708 RepID=A0A0A9DKA1_ARUDO